MRPVSIGVVVPTLNSAATLEWTLHSLLSQRDCRVEVIVADSGSTDGTLVHPSKVYGAMAVTRPVL